VLIARRFRVCLALRLNLFLTEFKIFFLLKLSAICTFWIVLICWCQKWFLKNKKISLTCISARKTIWKATTTTLLNTLLPALCKVTYKTRGRKRFAHLENASYTPTEKDNIAKLLKRHIIKVSSNYLHVFLEQTHGCQKQNSLVRRWKEINITVLPWSYIITTVGIGS
jgi:hypothetical protein